MKKALIIAGRPTEVPRGIQGFPTLSIMAMLGYEDRLSCFRMSQVYPPIANRHSTAWKLSELK